MDLLIIVTNITAYKIITVIKFLRTSRKIRRYVLAKNYDHPVDQT